MIHAETSQAAGIMIYAFGSSDEVITFYLEKVNEKRFQTKRIFTVDTVEGDHFWVTSRSRGESPQILRDKG
jgi:surfactin synthase thioesterase subunit